MPFSSWSPSCVLRSRCGSTSFLGRFLPELRLSPLTDAKMWTNVPAEGDSISRILGMVNIGVRSYVAEPDRGPRNWDGKEAEKKAVHDNRRRVQGERGKRLQRQRGERIERNFAHQFDTGGLDRLYVRGIKNVHKKFLIQAAACNLALLMRSLYGAGKPRAAHDGAVAAILAILAFIKALEDCF